MVGGGKGGGSSGDGWTAKRRKVEAIREEMKLKKEENGKMEKCEK